MTVYFIQNKKTKNIKIGYTSKDPKVRLRQLQTAHCDTLVLLEHIRGSKAFEHVLHVLCKHLRVRNEWFKPGCMIICRQYIKNSKAKRKPRANGKNR